MPVLSRPDARKLHPFEEFLAISVVLAFVCLPIFLWLGLDIRHAIPMSVLTGLTGQSIVKLILSPETDLFAPNILLAAYFGLYFAARCFFLLTNPKALEIGYTPYTDYLPQALWCASFGYIAVIFGYEFRSWSGGRFRRTSPFVWPTPTPTLRIFIVCLAGLASTLYLFSIGVTVGNLNNFAFVDNPPPGLPVLLETALKLGWLATCICLMVRKKRGVADGAWILFFLSLGLLFVRIAISGSKQAFLEPIIQVVISYHYLTRRIKLLQLLLLAIPLTFLAFGVINTYRFVIVGKDGPPKSMAELGARLSDAVDYYTSGNSSSSDESATAQLLNRQTGIDTLALAMKYTPAQQPYGYGRNYIQAPLQMLVPRQLWPDKPVLTPSLDFERTYMGVPVTFNGFTAMQLISDLYENFWWFGVGVGFFVFGSILRWAYDFCQPYLPNAAGVFLYCSLIPETIHGMESDLTGIVIWLIREVLLVVGVGLFIGIRYRSSTAGRKLPQAAAAQTI